MATETEAELRRVCAEQIQRYLSESGYPGLAVAQEQQVVMDCTFVPGATEIGLQLGPHKTDLVVYQPESTIDGADIDAGVVDVLPNASAEDVVIPLVAVELKRGNSTNAHTDNIRAKSFVADRMKRTFPFLGFFLAVDESSIGNGKQFRAANAFDAVFTTEHSVKGNEEKIREWVDDSLLRHGLEPHLEQLQHLNIL